MVIVFTCKVCETRAAKSFSRRAYDHGVVLVRCPGCENLHLVADRLGYFEDESWDLEKFLKESGGKVKAVNDDTVLELTPTDMVGGEGEEPHVCGSGCSHGESAQTR
jgi:mitochondrial protein import protein ZIM17